MVALCHRLLGRDWFHAVRWRPKAPIILELIEA